jgi:hypothetical protein
MFGAGRRVSMAMDDMDSMTRLAMHSRRIEVKVFFTGLSPGENERDWNPRFIYRRGGWEAGGVLC